MSTSNAARTFTIHVIDSYADIASAVRRRLKRDLGEEVAVTGFETPEKYFNAVSPDHRPDVLVIANRHPGMNGLALANKLREGFTGKIFIYTGGLPPAPTPDVDGVFYKGEDDRKLYQAISLAFRQRSAS